MFLINENEKINENDIFYIELNKQYNQILIYSSFECIDIKLNDEDYKNLVIRLSDLVLSKDNLVWEYNYIINFNKVYHYTMNNNNINIIWNEKTNNNVPTFLVTNGEM